MATLETHGITLYYELHGKRSNPPVVLISGLGGTGASWGSQVERFEKDYFVVLPDQRGTGRTTRSEGGYSIPQLAADTASLLRHLDVGPTHVVGSSTGGAIGQLLALEHADRVRSLTIASSFARADAYLRREFDLRRKLVAEADMRTLYSCYALFLFSPRFAREHPERVAAWVDRVAASPPEREVALKRIDMVMAHDALRRLREIKRPTLVISGEQDLCTPPQLSEELADGILGAERASILGGHLIHDEEPARFFDVVRTFIARH
jgi:aminoacrylate hydrolase